MLLLVEVLLKLVKQRKVRSLWESRFLVQQREQTNVRLKQTDVRLKQTNVRLKQTDVRLKHMDVHASENLTRNNGRLL